MPAREEMPSTLLRSSKDAQRLWATVHDNAVEQYGEGERAHRTAFAALKHSFEKVADHWEAKAEKGPSDDQAAREGARARRGGATAGGVDANASKKHLYDIAKRLDVKGRSRMSKDALVEAIGRANDRESRKAWSPKATELGHTRQHQSVEVQWSVGSCGSSPCTCLHGGAYVRELVKQHWQLVGQIAMEVGCDVHVPIYGLAPQHTGLEALDFMDAVRARVCADGRPTHLVGDSAGGGLALLAAQAAIGRTDVQIAGMTLIAPWLDLTMSNPEIDAVERTDPWLARPGLRPIASAWAGGLPLADPRLSPINGPMDALPPIDLWVGTRDITLPDCRLLRDRLPVRSLAGYHEQAGAIHDTPLLPVPEGRQARGAIIEQIRATVANLP